MDSSTSALNQGGIMNHNLKRYLVCVLSDKVANIASSDSTSVPFPWSLAV